MVEKVEEVDDDGNTIAFVYDAKDGGMKQTCAHRWSYQSMDTLPAMTARVCQSCGAVEDCTCTRGEPDGWNDECPVHGLGSF